ncbi:MAG: branched-chain amino acid ABC transporter permease [Haloferacaceae archaeon]
MVVEIGLISLGGRLSLVPQAAVTALVFGFVYALVAAGLALIWGVADIVNFAHGEYMLVAMYVTAFVTSSAGGGGVPLLLVPANAVLLFVLGYATYRLIISKVMDAPMLAQIFATFALVLIIRYAALFVAGPYTVSIDDYLFDGQTRLFGVAVSHPEVITGVVSVAALGVLFAFLRSTRTGKAIRATAQDREVARVMGIDTDHVFGLTWGIGLAAVGVAGTLVATFSPIHPELTPTSWTLIAFASVALGGFGSVLGAVAGGIVIAFVENLGGVLLNPSYKELYVFVVFIGVLLFKPEGILNWGES